MASVVQVSTISRAFGASNTSIFSSAVTSGNHILAVGSAASTDTGFSMTDDQAGSYTLLFTGAVGTSGSSAEPRFYLRQNVTDGADRIIFDTDGDSFRVAYAIEINGGLAATPLGDSASDVSNGNAVDWAMSLDTTNANSIIVQHFVMDGSRTITGDTGFTVIGSQPNYESGLYAEISGTGTQSQTQTLSSGATTDYWGIVIEAAAGGGGTNPKNPFGLALNGPFSGPV